MNILITKDKDGVLQGRVREAGKPEDIGFIVFPHSKTPDIKEGIIEVEDVDVHSNGKTKYGFVKGSNIHVCNKINVDLLTFKQKTELFKMGYIKYLANWNGTDTIVIKDAGKDVEKYYLAFLTPNGKFVFAEKQKRIEGFSFTYPLDDMEMEVLKNQIITDDRLLAINKDELEDGTNEAIPLKIFNTSEGKTSFVPLLNINKIDPNVDLYDVLNTIKRALAYNKSKLPKEEINMNSPIYLYSDINAYDIVLGDFLKEIAHDSISSGLIKEDQVKLFIDTVMNDYGFHECMSDEFINFYSRIMAGEVDISKSPTTTMLDQPIFKYCKLTINEDMRNGQIDIQKMGESVKSDIKVDNLSKAAVEDDSIWNTIDGQLAYILSEVSKKDKFCPVEIREEAPQSC